jgi:glycosyltransferase involved in cell wall biosynthesis
MTNSSHANPGEANLPSRKEGGLRLKGICKSPATDRPLISIVTVVRNGAKTLAQCIESVVRQQYKNIEYVVADGCSTDGTIDILRSYESSLDYWVSERDDGIFDAMNKAVGLTTGDWILFLGADDILLADIKDLVHGFLDRNTIYYGNAYWPGRDALYDGPFTAAKLARTNICQQAIFYPRTALTKYRHDPKYRFQADWELNMRCFSDPAFSFQYIPVTIVQYNDVDGSSTCNRDRNLENDYIALMRRHFSPPIALWRIAIALGGRCLRIVGRPVRDDARP